MTACAPPLAPTRVACVGDSLTAGDHFHRYNQSRTVRCRMSDPFCRGNFPLDLAALLGPAYEVKNFGIPGISTCGDLPTQCIERSPLNSSSLPLQAGNYTRFPLRMDASPEHLGACSSALRTQKSSQIARALDFEPQGNTRVSPLPHSAIALSSSEFTKHKLPHSTARSRGLHVWNE